LLLLMFLLLLLLLVLVLLLLVLLLLLLLLLKMLHLHCLAARQFSAARGCIQRKRWCMGLNPGVDYNSPYLIVNSGRGDC
jgi:hypothetical protein